jgi:hypothetical protein
LMEWVCKLKEELMATTAPRMDQTERQV